MKFDIVHIMVLNVIFLLCPFIAVNAQQQIDVGSSVIIIRSFRYMQNTADAEEIIKEAIARKHTNNDASQSFSKYDYSKKTSIDIIGQKENALLYEEHGTMCNDHRKNRKENQIHTSKTTGFLKIIGRQNITHLLDEAFGEIDFYENTAELMSLKFKSPLADDALKTYRYHLLGSSLIDNNECYEIAFFAKNIRDNAFAGYLYIDTSNTFALRKAVFTLSDPSSMNFMKNVLFTHFYANVEGIICPVKKENAVVWGDEMQEELSLAHSLLYPENSASVKMEKLIGILLTNHVTVGGINGKFELGPMFQFLSYNDMEGVRLRIGGNTATALMNQLQLGGYLAFGTKDKQWKYRGNLIYSFLPREKNIWEYPKKLLSFTCINDLNIPGQDLLTTTRDNIMYSFSHTATNNMSFQKTGLLTFENENNHNFSYLIGAKYTSDRPVGIVKYMKASDTVPIFIDRMETAELKLSLRYSPRERFFQNRDNRIPIRRGNIELTFDHRIGIKGIIDSGYDYQITNAKVNKKFNLGNNTGSLETGLSAGMIWNKVPFPLLFIPIGNQSYIYQTENYNCMNFYEFITDRFLAGNVNFTLNWSPVKWLDRQSKVKTSLGTRVIYGPLSDKNNPELHPELFVFNKGVTPLNATPYAEINAGLIDIFKFLRVEYAHRLTYINKHNTGGNKANQGSLLISSRFAF